MSLAIPTGTTTRVGFSDLTGFYFRFISVNFLLKFSALDQPATVHCLTGGHAFLCRVSFYPELSTYHLLKMTIQYALWYADSEKGIG